MGSSSSAEERQNAVNESYSYSNVQTGEAQPTSPHSVKGPKSRDATPMSMAHEATRSVASNEERALIQKATPAAFTKVKLWQLVLFSTLLFLMFVCTIMVLISYCGGYLGYAPLIARSPKIQRPKVLEHPWEMEKVAFDCSTDRWRDTEEWSDIKLDYCCENMGVGCERVPGYSCDAVNEAPLFTEKRWCCTQESIFCEHLDHDLQVASKQGLPECSKPGPGSCRDFDCNKGHEHWWLDWSAPKIQLCCHEAFQCQGAGVPLVPKISAADGGKAPSQHRKDVAPSCSDMCIMDEQERSCMDWIFFLADSIFKDDASPCHMAVARVHARCPACSESCSSALACEVPQPHV